MKKLIAVLIMTVMTLSLAACGEDAESVEKIPYDRYVKYSEILNLLENNDYSGAIKEIEAMGGLSNPTVDSDDAQSDISSKPVDSNKTENEENNGESDEDTVVYIRSAEDLFSIKATASKGKTYLLAVDLDLTGVSASIEEFQGMLDGNGKVIRNATAPLIKKNRGTVRNIVMENGQIEVEKDAAAVVVRNYGTVYGCSVKGAVSCVGENAYAGGVVCWNEPSGVIEACENYATVYAHSYAINELGNVIHGTWAVAGGVCSYNQGNILCCMNGGSISAEGAEYISSGGGIVSANTRGEVKDCYNCGEVSGLAPSIGDFGGIAGFSDKGRFVNCCNVGVAPSGIIGDNRDYLIDCYYLSDVSQNGSGRGLNTAGERIHSFTRGQLTNPETFPTLDFEAVWEMTEDGPTLRKD